MAKNDKAYDAARRRALYATPEGRAKILSQQLKWRYGISTEQRDAMVDEQGGCAICGSDEPRGKGWTIDHDHSCCPGLKSCGECIRGVLCQPCNMAIGLMRDDPEILLAAARYLTP